MAATPAPRRGGCRSGGAGPGGPRHRVLRASPPPDGCCC